MRSVPPHSWTIMVTGLIIAAAFTSVAWIPDLLYAGRILPGVTLLGIYLGNTQLSVAQLRLSGIGRQDDLTSIQLQFKSQIWDINPADFGLRVNPDQLAKVAFSVGRRGAFDQRLAEDWLGLFGQSRPLVVQDQSLYDFDRSQLTSYLQVLAGEIEQPRRNAHLEIQNQRAVQFTPPQDGLQLNINKSIELIASNLLSDNRVIDLPVITTPPAVTLTSTNNLGIDQLIGRGESNFSGSPKNRRHNIGVGAARFNGIIIPPGKTFSFVQNLGTVDATTGYLPELVIKGDETIPEFGGGLCQVSTTAFRAVLHSGLPVVERHNHSYRVSYYEPAGLDATIYQPSPDLKFTNDTPGSILISAYVTDNKLYFDFYGTDTGRRIELDGPHIFNVTDYADPVYIDTSTLPVGELKQVDIAHRGADAVVYRKVYQGDKLIINDTFKSHYVPWPAKYLRGVADAAKVEADLNNVEPAPVSSPSTPAP